MASRHHSRVVAFPAGGKDGPRGRGPARSAQHLPSNAVLQQGAIYDRTTTGFQHRCKMVYLAQRLQPGVKLASPSEAALLEYGSGGTPAAQTHLLLPECGGSKTICRHRSGPQEVSRGLHVLWTQALLTAAPARLGDGGVTWMSAQDRRSTALKLLRHMGPQQGQHCQQEGGKRSLPTFFPFSVAYPQQRFFLQTLRAGIQRSAHK